MCGIGGVFLADRHQSVDRQLLVNMAAIQSHRGPDGFGVALRSFCRLCDEAQVAYHLTDFKDLEAIRGY